MMTDDLPPTPGEPTGPTGDAPPADAPRTEAPPSDPPRGAPGATTPGPELRRTSGDKVLGGVAGGLARTLDVDAVLVRIALVVLGLVFPPLVFAYVAAWLLLPADGEPVGRRYGRLVLRDGGIGFWVGVAVLAAAAIASLGDPGLGGFPLLPLVLIGVGVALWSREGARRPASLPGYEPPAATTTVDPSTTPDHPSTGSSTVPTQSPPRPTTGADSGGPPQAPVAPAAAPQGSPPAPPRRPRSPLGAITIALALIATGVVAALDQVPSIPMDADPTHLAAVALLVLGLGQLVGAVWGRARWLTVVALLLIPPVLVGAAIRELDGRIAGAELDLDLGDGIGERTVVLDDDEDLPDDVRLLAGSIRVDLEDWRPTSAQLAAIDADDTDLYVAVGAGEVEIWLPADVAWRVVGEVGLGELSVRDADGVRSRDSGDDLGVPLSVVRRGGPSGGPVLDIVVDVRLGELTINTTDTTEELS